MTSLPINKFREDLAEVLNQVAYKGERVIVTRHNKEVAAFVSMDDLKLLELLEERFDLSNAAEMIDAIKSGREELLDWNKIKDSL